MQLAASLGTHRIVALHVVPPTETGALSLTAASVAGAPGLVMSQVAMDATHVRAQLEMLEHEASRLGPAFEADEVIGRLLRRSSSGRVAPRSWVRRSRPTK